MHFYWIFLILAIKLWEPLSHSSPDSRIRDMRMELEINLAQIDYDDEKNAGSLYP